MKGMMRRLQRGALFVLLAIQVLGGGAVTLAHARDVVSAPPAFESRHDARCPVLHDAMRCALCHYASAQVAVHQAIIVPGSQAARVRVPASRRIVAVSDAVHRTAPARAPPTLLS